MISWPLTKAGGIITLVVTNKEEEAIEVIIMIIPPPLISLEIKIIPTLMDPPSGSLHQPRRLQFLIEAVSN
jgi:hypothetical protein